MSKDNNSKFPKSPNPHLSAGLGMAWNRDGLSCFMYKLCFMFQTNKRTYEQTNKRTNEKYRAYNNPPPNPSILDANSEYLTRYKDFSPHCYAVSIYIPEKEKYIFVFVKIRKILYFATGRGTNQIFK